MMNTNYKIAFTRPLIAFCNNNKVLNVSCKFFIPVMSKKQIYYSDKYTDDEYEYRHVMLPKDLAKMVPKTHLMSETEWRNLGVQQSQGKIFYSIFAYV